MNHSGTISANISVTSDGQIWKAGSGTTLTIGGTVTFTNETLYIEGATTGETVFTGSGTHSGGSLRIRNYGKATFSAGSLSVGSAYIGYGSTGTLNWNSAGTLTSEYVISMSVSGGAGIINQSAGQVNCVGSDASHWGLLYEGNGGHYTSSGGTLQIGKLDCGSYTGGQLNLGGTLTATGDLTSGNLSRLTHSLSGTAVINTNGYSVTLPGVISDSGSLTKNGTGTLTLSGTNTFTGTTRINAGTLTLNNALALQSSTLDLNSGDSGSLSFGTLELATFGGLTGSRNLTLQNGASVSVAFTVGNNNTDKTYSGVLSGSGSLARTGTGTLTLSNRNTYSGGTTISVGTLFLSGAANRLATSGSITFAGGTLDLGGYGQTTSSTVSFQASDGAIIQNGTLTLSGSSTTITASQSATISANIAVTTNNQHWTVTASNKALTLGGNVTFTNQTLYIEGQGETKFSGVSKSYSGGGLWVGEQGTATFTAGDLATWSTMAGSGSNGGTINWNSSGTLSAYRLYVGYGSNGTVTQTAGEVNTSDDVEFDGGTYNLNGGTLKATAFSDYSGGSVPAGCTLSFGGGTLQATTRNWPYTVGAGLAYTIGDGATATINTNGYNVALAGVISNASQPGNGSVAKTGTGTLTLSGNNTYTGGTAISQGTISASSIVVSGGSSNLGNASSAILLGDAMHTGTLSYTGNTASYTRGFTVGAGGGELDVTAGWTLTLESGGITANGALTIGGLGNASITSVVSGNGGLAKAAAGTLTLAGSNTFTGTTRINAGTLTLSNALALQSSTLDLNSGDSGNLSFGTLELATFGGLTGSRNLTLQNGSSVSVALTVGNNNTDKTYSGVLSGSGSLTKNGTGTLTLSGTNTFTGTTRINAGTLTLNNALALQSSTLDLNSGDSGSLSFGTLQLATFGGLTGSRNLTLQNGSSVSVALTVGTNNTDKTYSGILSGSGSTRQAPAAAL